MRNAAATARLSGPFGVTLRAGKGGERVAVDPCEQVGERREREVGLGRGRPAREHQRAPLPGAAARLAPERRLADPGVALQHQDGKSRSRRVQEPLDLEQLRFAANDSRWHGGGNCTGGP